jgi:hypothetical protein
MRALCHAEELLIACTPSSPSGEMYFRCWHKCEVPTVLSDVRFSNRPFGVKRFQTIHLCGVDVTRELVLLFGRRLGPSIMGSEDEAEQSFGRPCRQCDGGSKRTYELISSIVPRGTSFHCWVDL